MRTFIVGDHESTASRIRQVLLFGGRECPESHVLPLERAAGRLAREKAELVTVGLSPDFDRGLAALAAIRSAVPAKLLAVGPAGESKAVLRALRQGADDYVDEADVEVDLEAALARLAVSGGARDEPGRAIAVVGPSGGVGSSTLAANLAAALAKAGGKGVGLVDMKLESGDLAALLDLKPTFTLADLCQNVARMDKEMFERSLVRHPSGVQLLAPPRLPGDARLVSADGVRLALDLACTLFPQVVVDVDHTYRDEQAQALRRADIILLLFRLDFTALRNAKRMLEHLERLEVEPEKIRLVVNRFGQPKEVPAAKAAEALGKAIYHYVPDDSRSVNRANNNGVPVVIEAPRSRVSKSITKLAQGLAARTPAS